MRKVKYAIFIFIVSCVLTKVAHTYAAPIEENLSLGYKAYQDGNFEKAVEYLQSSKKDDFILSDYSFYYLGEAYLSLNRFDEAFDSFEACIKYYAKSPLASSAAERMGNVYFAKNDVANAINTYKGFLESYPNNPQTQSVLYKLVSILLSHNRYDEAIPFIKRLLTEFPQTYYDNSFVSQVLSNEVRKLNSDEFYIRLKALLKIRNYETAVKEIKEYLFEGSPWFPYEVSSERNDKLRLLLGQAFYQTRYLKNANEVFKDIFSNTHDTRMRAESLLWTARAYVKLKDFKPAQNALRTFMAVYPDIDLKDEAIYRLAMIAKDEGDGNLAIALLRQLLAEHTGSFYKDEALWQISWLHYTNRNLEESIKTLKTMEGSPLRIRSLYWQGKIANMLGKQNEAKNLFKTAADNFPPTYYSAMSKKALEQIGVRTYLLPVTFPNNTNQTIQPTTDGSLPIKRTQKLLELGLNNLALKELAYIDQRQSSLDISLLYRAAGDFYHSYLIAKGQTYNSLPSSLLYQLAFPEGYKETVEKIAAGLKTDPFLIYAIMMQESEFDIQAISKAGAIGLLQIMPATGKIVAQELAHSSFTEDDLFEPAINIHFGAWYIKTLITRFNGNLPLAIAAYNAGPNAVDEWMKKWKGTDMDEFIENIPYQETRKYVEKVLGYYEAYKAIYPVRSSDSEKPFVSNRNLPQMEKTSNGVYSPSPPATRNSQSAQDFD
ncbi:MAG: transglycosylase SLT domain-containing protein [Deltaproteobacteria bacterium]|nr:transglycosylase SLT domain-containing protein [Deltaproteobacteria bacterium]